MTDIPPHESPTDRLVRLASCGGTEYGARFEMHLERRSQGPTLVIRGSLVQDIPDGFADRVKEALHKLKAPETFIDLQRCENVASTALAFLVHFHRVSTTAGAKQVVIQHAQPRVMTLLKLLGLHEIFTIADPPRRTPRPA
ncbi:hypothetical protein LBMAG53_00180 [Planctomycetota bacterium]|nr:hypothetical protein LBMAG53_00180 [Planctomycetota bacterium]